MHPLVHIWVRERPQMTARAQAVWCEAALHTLSRCVLLPPLNGVVDPHGNLARKLLPHFISVAKLQQKIKEEFIINHEKRRRPWPALESGINPWRAMFLAKLAIAYSECGYFAETEACLRIVMEFNSRWLGPHHPRTERVRLAVSDCLWHQCRVNDAAMIQEQVLQENLTVLGPDHPRTLQLMDKLGESRRHQGRLAESIELLTKARNGLSSQLPDDNPAVYHTLEQLGATLRACFRFEDAKWYQEQAVSGMKKCLGDNHMSTLIATEELAITYKELGCQYMDTNKTLARKYLETAHALALLVVEQRTSQLGEKQPHTWMAQGTLGRIKAAMGDVEEAENIFSSILPVAVRHLGPDHLGVLSHKTHHSKILIQQERFKEAEACLVEICPASKYRIATSTGDHPDRWDALWALVDCYKKQGKVHQSLETCNDLLEAVGAVRHGKEQTEMSSVFWEMMRAKREELVGMIESGIAEKSPVSIYESPTEIQSKRLDSKGGLIRESGGLKFRGTW